VEETAKYFYFRLTGAKSICSTDENYERDFVIHINNLRKYQLNKI
jgi:hypothetical protein